MTLEHLHGRASPTRRMSARADSVPGVEKALGRIWADLSRQGMTERTDEHGATMLARTRVLTLVVVASKPETTERAMDAIVKLAGRHPSRTIVLGLGDPDGPPRLDARVQAHCHPFGRSSEVCTEQIVVNVAGEACQHPATVATPLLLHDLPVALWWCDDPPIGGRPFGQLVALADRLVIDSGLFRDDGRARLAELASHAHRPLEVHDIGWMRLELWRALLAGLFDDPALTSFLDGTRKVRLHVARMGSVVRLSRAALYLGWLASRLGWRVERPLEPAGREGLRASFVRGRHRIEVEVAPEDLSKGHRQRASGGLARVELSAERRNRRVDVAVTRGDDHLMAEAFLDGRSWATRAATIERFEDAPYLAAALEAAGQDASFEAALPLAAEIAALGDR